MDPAIEKLSEQLSSARDALDKGMPSGASLTTQAGWSAPSVGYDDLARSISDIQSIVRLHGPTAQLSDDDRSDIKDLTDRISFVEANVIPNIWPNPVIAVTTFFISAHYWKLELSRILGSDPTKNLADDLLEFRKRLNKATATLDSVEPDTTNLSKMVADIRNAYEAADRLPEDVASLKALREKLTSITFDAQKTSDQIKASHEVAIYLQHQMNEIHAQAQLNLTDISKIYAAATSLGLAKSFSERSKSLANSMYVWVIGLVVSLTVAGILGSLRLSALSGLLEKPNVTSASLILSTALSALSIGAPIWFAWLSTRQIGQQFRLSEDYAYKASISQAYEGYRREAARIDPKLEAQLLASALSRLDQEPLRLVDDANHNSPAQELLSSEVVKSTVNKLTEIPTKIDDAIKNAVSPLKRLNGGQDE